jgi:16S rRNA G966 N2-methylase RsmD
VVEAAIEAAASRSIPTEEGFHILDIGTGSGCIAIALALALPDAQITAWDISPEALAVAKRNAVNLGVDSRVTFAQCDALSPAAWSARPSASYHLIVSNPPYIAHTEQESLSTTVRGFEPHSALFAADEGLIFYKQLASQASAILRPDGQMILEIGSSQAKDVLEILAAKGWTSPKVLRDLGRNDRCIVASHPRAVPQSHARSTGAHDDEDTPVAHIDANTSTRQAGAAGSKTESPSTQKRAGATAAGEPVYVALEEPHRGRIGASAGKQLEIHPGALEERPSTASADERTYIPLDPFGQPKRSGATRSAPIEYVTQNLSGDEEELLAKYATENASDLETEP